MKKVRGLQKVNTSLIVFIICIGASKWNIETGQSIVTVEAEWRNTEGTEQYYQWCQKGNWDYWREKAGAQIGDSSVREWEARSWTRHKPERAKGEGKNLTWDRQNEQSDFWNQLGNTGGRVEDTERRKVESGNGRQASSYGKGKRWKERQNWITAIGLLERKRRAHKTRKR